MSGDSLCVEMDRLEDAMEDETEESSSTYDESYADNQCKGFDINGETLYQEPSKRRAWNAHHLIAAGRRVHFDDTIDFSAPDTEVSTAENWKQALEEFEDENDCKNNRDDSDGNETNDERCTVPRTACIAKATKTTVLSEQLDFPSFRVTFVMTGTDAVTIFTRSALDGVCETVTTQDQDVPCR